MIFENISQKESFWEQSLRGTFRFIFDILIALPPMELVQFNNTKITPRSMERTEVYCKLCKYEKCVYEREITVRQETRFTLYSKLTNFYLLTFR